MTTLSTGFKFRVFIALVASTGLFAAIIFCPAGRIDWLAGWLYLAVVATSFFANLVYLMRVNPELIEHRMRIHKGTKRWDTIWGVLFAPVFLAIYVIAGFDAVRFEWSAMPAGFWPLGLVIFLPGMALFIWSMGVNPFFEKTVRIQTERGHRVIDTGPYGFIRHPGYLGFLAWSISIPLFLLSWWAFLPALLSVVGIVIRTALEDRTLRKELTGYEEYTRRVRYRLIPRIW